MMSFYDNPCMRNKYLIQDLLPTDKVIKIINFYDNRVIFFGKQKDIPEFWKDSRVRIFTDFPTHFEIFI